jgi:hypothetical protein
MLVEKEVLLPHFLQLGLLHQIEMDGHGAWSVKFTESRK